MKKAPTAERSWGFLIFALICRMLRRLENHESGLAEQDTDNHVRKGGFHEPDKGDLIALGRGDPLGIGPATSLWTRPCFCLTECLPGDTDPKLRVFTLKVFLMEAQPFFSAPSTASMADPWAAL